MISQAAYWIVFFGITGFVIGLLAIYYFIELYYKTQKGSKAWLLFAVTSIFMITVPIFPNIILFSDAKLEQGLRIFMDFTIFWSALYTSFFAAAGYVLYSGLVKTPKKELKKFLVNGFSLDVSNPVSSACGVDCSRCPLFIEEKCTSCIPENSRRESEEGSKVVCPVYNCAAEQGVESCWKCARRKRCELYRKNSRDCPIADKLFVMPEVMEVSNLLKGRVLFSYDSIEGVENAIIEIILRTWSELRNTTLITSQPRASVIGGSLSDLIDIGVLKIVNMSSTTSNLELSEQRVDVPLDDLDDLTSMLSDIPKNCMIIVDTLTRMVNLFSEDVALDFVSNILKPLDKAHNIIVLTEKKILSDRALQRLELMFDVDSELRDQVICVQIGKEWEYIDMHFGRSFYVT